MKATAKAHANIAFIKYWGKKDRVLRLPLNSTISMNLSEAYTITTVEFSEILKEDDISLSGAQFFAEEKNRISKHLDLIRGRVGKKIFAKVATQNSFPKGAGIASSASGFAALTLAACAALDLSFSEKKLSILARLGSGSASRSIPDGFVEWIAGESSETSYAYSLQPADYWNICDIICMVDTRMKKISTTSGMDLVQTSPFFQARLTAVETNLEKLKKALNEKDFKAFGEITEQDAIQMHAVAMTQNPPVFYWNAVTMSIIHAVQLWRNEGLGVYFTIDAGPNVHLICEGKDEQIIIEKLREVSGVKQLLKNKPAEGAKMIKEHLF